MKLTPRVDFTIVLGAGFTRSDPKVQKIQSSLFALFVLLQDKVALKTLMKLTS